MKTIIIDGIEYNLTPKVFFKKGDFVVIKETTYLISKIEGLNVTLSLNGRECLFGIDVLKNARLWDITIDAEDGDVLADNVGVILFKSIGDNNVINFHAYFSGLFAVQEGEQNWGHVRECTLSPATKEQRERFYAAMHEAGFEWDAEHKQLKKIEQKPIDCNEEYYNEELKSALFTSLRDAREQYLREKNAAWSEEDENEVAILESYIRSGEWSESHIDRALGIVDELVNKVKSLIPQKQWKPSEKQMEALEHFVRSIGESGYASPYENNTKLLYSLLEQLKKL